HLALDDRDEGVAPVAHTEQHVAHTRTAFLAELGEERQLRRGQDRTCGTPHNASLPVRIRVPVPEAALGAELFEQRSPGTGPERVDETEERLTNEPLRVIGHQNGAAAALNGECRPRA